jgi:hypothetical protein
MLFRRLNSTTATDSQANRSLSTIAPRLQQRLCSNKDIDDNNHDKIEKS